MSESAPVEEKPKSAWPQRIAMGVAVAAGIYAYQNWDSVSVQLFGASAYTCTNIVPQVVQISEKNGSPLLPKVIGIIEAKLISETDSHIECAGTAMLSTAQKTAISYRAYEDGGQWWIKYEAKTIGIF